MTRLLGPTENGVKKRLANPCSFGKITKKARAARGQETKWERSVYEKPASQAFSVGLYLDRTPGGGRHHCHSGGAAFARAVIRQRQSAGGHLHVQLEGMRPGQRKGTPTIMRIIWRGQTGTKAGAGGPPGWLYFVGAEGMPNPFDAPWKTAGGSDSAWQTGLWWNHLPNHKTFLCPVDIKSPTYTKNQRNNELSSYVMNGAVCGYANAQSESQYQLAKKRLFGVRPAVMSNGSRTRTNSAPEIRARLNSMTGPITQPHPGGRRRDWTVAQQDRRQYSGD